MGKALPQRKVFAKGIEVVDVVPGWRTCGPRQPRAHLAGKHPVRQLLGLANVIFIARSNHLKILAVSTGRVAPCFAAVK